MAKITVDVEVPDGSECKSAQGLYCRFHTDFGMCKLLNDRRPQQGMKKCRKCLLAVGQLYADAQIGDSDVDYHHSD